MKNTLFFQTIKKTLKNIMINDLPTWYPIILLVTVCFGIFLAFVINRTDYAIRGLIVAVPGVLAAGFLIWFFRRKYLNKELADQGFVSFESSDHKKFNIFLVFILFYLLSIISLLVVPYRPWYYFVFIAALFSLIFFQIIHNNSSSLILTEILFTSLNLIYGVTLKYPLFFGATDTIPHLYLSKIMFLSGHIIIPELDIFYTNYPLYHIFIAISTLFSGLPLKISYFIVIAIPFAFVLLLLYKLFFILSENTTVTLIGCLLYATSSVVVEYSQYVVTRVFAYIGFIILIYSFYKIIKSPPHLRTSIYCIILLDSLFLVFVHQVSLYQIIFLLFLFFVIEKIIEDKKIINLKYMLFLITVFIGYQLFSQGGFFSTLIKTRFNSLINENIATVRSSIQNINEYGFLTSHVGLAIIAFFIFFGIGYTLWTYKSKHLSVIGLFTLVTLIFFLPNPVVMSTIITVYFRADRITLLIAPFMAFIAAIGLYVLLNCFLEKQMKRNYIIALFLTIIFIFSFASIALPIASDSQDFWWYHDQRDDYFNNEELQSFNFINYYVPVGSNVLSDNAVSIFFNTKENPQSDELHLPYYNSQIFTNVDFKSEKIGYSVLRTDEFLDNGLELNSGFIGEWEKFQPTSSNIRYLNYYSSSRNVIFDSKGMKIVYV